ncbi:OmpA family protein [Flavobacterium sp.]|uniref:OmpA family protein n=1 Tax=Flavobacterium sp. TaxID=239 RepID=UPI00260BFE8A|nr:OmpA family protein [Flavobacterium sp.]MDD3004021.1 OmpA family protein [Flavobacterium sp.]
MLKKFLLYITLLFFSVPLWSQKTVKKGNEQFRQLAYSEAIISLEKAVAKGLGNPSIYAQLAESYYANADYKSAAQWFLRLEKAQKKLEPLQYFKYAQSLKSLGNYKEAAEKMKNIPELSGIDIQNSLKNIEKNSGRYQISLWHFNSASSDFSPAFYKDKIVFTSSRDTGAFFKRKHTWTNDNFTDLYIVHPDSISSQPLKFSKKVNTQLNESSAVFTKDGGTMYFTRNNFHEGKKGIDRKHTTLLKIYKAVKTDKEWHVEGALPFCKDNYNVAHPALSTDEKTLYFASDMPGGFGQSDLYKVNINTDGSFGMPENLGSEINTLGRETFPFITEKNEFYFASDGHENLGGLDVFVSQITEDNMFTRPRNVGEPMNSQWDDFGLIIHSDTKTGYFSSNRGADLAKDNIYSFKELTPLECKTILVGKVLSNENEQSLVNVRIVAVDEHQNILLETVSDENGGYYFKINCNQKITLQFFMPEFSNYERKMDVKFQEIISLSPVVLQKDKPEFELGDDLGKKLHLLPIYFDLGKANIREDAAIELEKVKTVLNQYPRLRIEVRSHTDSRDTFKNNQKLSSKRAQSTVEWFVQNGIDAQRVQGVGYGEQQLTNACTDGVICSEAEHQLNRRSEFIIIGI